MTHNTKQTVIKFEAKNFKDFFQKSINDLLESKARSATIDNYLQDAG